MKQLDFHETIASIITAFQNDRTKFRKKSQLQSHLKVRDCESECLERALGFLIRNKFLSVNQKKDQQFEMIGTWTLDLDKRKVAVIDVDGNEINLGKEN